MIPLVNVFSLVLSFAFTQRSLKTYLKTITNAAFYIAVATAIAGQISYAQQLPSAPEPTNLATSQPQEQIALADAPEFDKPGSFSSSSAAMPAYEPAASFSFSRPAPTPRTADTKFFLVNGLHLGLAIADVELTQHCMANHQCHEGNPLMPSSQAGQLSVSLGYVALSSFVSFRQKKHKSALWWLAPSAGMASHTVGIASGLANY